MASNPPGPCCCEISFHTGTPVGSISEVYGLNTYVIGKPSETIIIIATDIFGYQLKNTQLVADALHAKTGYQVYIPDLFNGEALRPNPSNREEIGAWLGKHSPETTLPPFNKFVSELKKDLTPKFVAGIGYCYGAKLVISNIGEEGPLDIGCVAHPSFVDVAEIEKVKKPLLISAAQDDPALTVELRHKTEEILTKNKNIFQIDLFSNTRHGYAVKGDFSKPLVRYAANKTLADQALWIQTFGPKGSCKQCSDCKECSCKN
ncbi:DEKNAAC100568 [Brettanomyces naardenensis]|uniref:DEKNAAC100569 n=1 Tax=Brettanomyces naardenensis TaxID=13370 RepID=A0A448YEJ7_BRENA|nr:DEKNAAC100568 [Brettanomyces naardenensis]